MSQAVVMNIALEDYDLSQTVSGTNVVAADIGDNDDPSDDKPATKAGGVQSIYDLFKNRMNVVKVAGTNDFQEETDGGSKTYKVISVGDKEDYNGFCNIAC